MGVELAAEIAAAAAVHGPQHKSITLMTSGSELCRGLPSRVGALAREWLEARGVLIHFGARVQSVSDAADNVVLESGEVICADGRDAAGRDMLVYDCRGNGKSHAAPLTAALTNASRDGHGRVIVRDTLQLPSAPCVYAMGDVAVRDGGMDARLAHTAELHAHVVAENVMRQERGDELLSYPRGAVGSDNAPQVYAVSLGEANAIVSFVCAEAATGTRTYRHTHKIHTRPHKILLLCCCCCNADKLSPLAHVLRLALPRA